jgi:hypothetical protein
VGTHTHLFNVEVRMKGYYIERVNGHMARLCEESVSRMITRIEARTALAWMVVTGATSWRGISKEIFVQALAEMDKDEVGLRRRAG